MRTRLTRSEQAAANRQAVLDAARVVFLRAGYHGTTVEAIAGEAGFTIGALYSRFGGKADVYLALLEERIEARAELFRDIAPAADIDQVPREFARRWAGVMRAELDWSLLGIEFRVHAARHPELNARYAVLHERALESLTDNLARSVPEGAGVTRARLRDLARVALAASSGAALARAVEGDAFSDQLYEELSLTFSRWFIEGGDDDRRDDDRPPRTRTRANGARR